MGTSRRASACRTSGWRMIVSLLLEVSHLSKSFVTSHAFGRNKTTHRAVDDIDLELHEGETLAIVGESGAGKSTTGRLVLRLIEPDHGSISFDGRDLRSLDRAELRRQRPRMQMVFQSPRGSFNPLIRLRRAMTEPMRVHLGLNKVDRERRAIALFERVGLDPKRLDSFPRELSGGQLQRVAIARALALGPKLLVCDEITSALDVSVRAQVLNLLIELQESDGLAYLFITHDLALAEALASTTMVMQHGRVVERGDTRALLSDPQDPYTHELVASRLGVA